MLGKTGGGGRLRGGRDAAGRGRQWDNRWARDRLGERRSLGWAWRKVADPAAGVTGDRKDDRRWGERREFLQRWLTSQSHEREIDAPEGTRLYGVPSSCRRSEGEVEAVATDR